MNIFALQARFAAALSLLALTGSTAVAQAPSAGAPTGAPTAINAAFVKLFGSIGAFTAKVDTQAFDQSQKETVRMPMDFAVLEGKVRLEIHVDQIQSQALPASAVAGLKQAGMDRIISVFHLDKKAAYVIYPGIQSYMKIPLSEAEAKATDKNLKLEKNALGKETIDAHPCVKNKTVVKNDQGPVLEAVTWNATDLKEFPVQIELKDKKSTVRMRFSQVRFEKLDARQFDPPASYGLMK